MLLPMVIGVLRDWRPVWNGTSQRNRAVLLGNDSTGHSGRELEESSVRLSPRS